MHASTTLSISSWRTTRQRVAPMAVPDGNLARPVGRARQQQVGDVRAGDQQHEHDRAHHDHEQPRRRAADEALRQRFDADAHDVPGRLVRVRGLEMRARCRSISACACAAVRRPSVGRRRAAAALPPSSAPRSARTAPTARCCRGISCPSGITPTMVAGLPVDAQDPAEDVRIAAVAVLPEAVADDRDRLGAGSLVAGREVAAEERRLPAARRTCWR